MDQTRYPSKNWDFKSRFSFESNSITVNSNTITLSSIQCILNSLLNGRCTFIFTTLLMHAITPTSLLIHPSTSVNVHLPISALPVHKIILTIPTNTSYFCVQPSQQSTPKTFSTTQPFSQFRLYQGTRELRSRAAI